MPLGKIHFTTLSSTARHVIVFDKEELLDLQFYVHHVEESESRFHKTNTKRKRKRSKLYSLNNPTFDYEKHISLMKILGVY